MTKIWEATSLKPSRKLMSRLQERGTRGDLAKTLAELVKNCDDTYGRAEDKNQNPKGEMIIGYWTKKDKVVGCFVRDYGMGMDKDILKSAYYEYGRSEEGINSAVGVGGKDALWGYANCYVFTVRDQTPLVAQISTDPVHRDLTSEAWDGDDAIKFFKKFNLDAKMKDVPPLDPNTNGTTVAFKIPTSMVIPFEKLRSRLKSYYTLRKILSEKRANRRIYMVDINKGEKTRLMYSRPEIEARVSTIDFKVPYRNKEYSVKGEVFCSKKELSKDRDTGENVLILNEKGAVLDNTLLGYESRPGGAKIFGEIMICEWRKLYEEDGTILTDNREGLDWNNPFNKLLKLKLIRILEESVSNVEKQLTPVKIDPKFERSIQRALSKINNRLKKEASTEIRGGGDIKSPPEVLEFSPSLTEVLIGRPRKVSILVNPRKVPESSVIEIRCNNPIVSIEPYPSLITPSKYLADIPSLELNISGNNSGAATIFAAYGEKDAKLDVKVVTEDEIRPLYGMMFNPERKKVLVGKPCKLRLIIDTLRIPVGHEIRIESTNQLMKVNRDRFLVSSPNLSASLREEEIVVVGGANGDKSDIIASTQVGSIPWSATASITVIKKPTPKSFFNNVRLDTVTEKGRYHFDKYEKGEFSGDGVIWIHGRSPVLQMYFGKNLKNLSQIKDEKVKIMLAEVITQCICEIWGRYRLDKGLEISTNPDDFDEIKRAINNIDSKWGIEIHSEILRGISF